MKKYFAYIDDGRDVYKVAVPANSEKDCRDYVSGNGEVIAIKSADEYKISLDCVAKALVAAHFGAVEIDLIIRTLSRTNIGD